MEINQKTLHEWLDYEPETGIFTWKKQPAHSVKAGDQAGSVQVTKGTSRRVISIKGQRFYASRAAYIYVNGDISKKVLVDHKNGDACDDRICNLRLASTAQNTYNRIQKAGSKYKMGVSKDPRSRFKARIQLPSGKKFNLGAWDTEAEAHAAYMGAAAILHESYWVGHREPGAREVQNARGTQREC
jgi:hypothetical protein